jgi:fructoselysine-6-P-deglycase FrlB-like protein
LTPVALINDHEDMTEQNTRVPGADMQAELTSQPDVWERAAQVSERRLLPADGQRIAVVGCGTSWFMAQAYANLRERDGRGETDAYAASEAFIDRDYDAIVAITRSGTTTEVLELLDAVRSHARRSTPRTIGVVGDPQTPLVDLVDDVIALPFADEKSVVQTRFATSALALLRASIGTDLSDAVAQARAVLDEELDLRLVDAEQYTFLGTGWSVGIAHEAALKMRESSQSWTESYPAKEYRHGPIAIAAPGRVTWAFGHLPDGIVADTTATGVHFEHRDIDPMADLVRLHRVALERARGMGLDPDQPRNLTRSVILERP